ncbi:hypothetical protein AA313_de0207788 [Arthrobotrys entomopaga]|nr:hypothetical protein AA313_de0207788 [Arthrobotrys entomopaga]
MVALDGDRLLTQERPATDISLEGSDIITKVENGYLIDTYDEMNAIHVYDRMFTHLVPLVLLGRTIPTSLKSVIINNGVLLGSAAKPPYMFTTSAANGFFVVKRAFKNHDKALVKENHFSEILYRIWHDLAKDQGVRVDSLRYVVHDYVVNPESQEVVLKILDDLDEFWNDVSLKYGSKTVVGLEIRLRADTEDKNIKEAFDAMVGCPNGKGVARMLNDHSHALGQKEISQVLIYIPDWDEKAPYVMYEMTPREASAPTKRDQRSENGLKGPVKYIDRYLKKLYPF